MMGKSNEVGSVIVRHILGGPLILGAEQGEKAAKGEPVRIPPGEGLTMTDAEWDALKVHPRVVEMIGAKQIEAIRLAA